MLEKMLILTIRLFCGIADNYAISNAENVDPHVYKKSCILVCKLHLFLSSVNCRICAVLERTKRYSIFLIEKYKQIFCENKKVISHILQNDFIMLFLWNFVSMLINIEKIGHLDGEPRYPDQAEISIITTNFGFICERVTDEQQFNAATLATCMRAR